MLSDFRDVITISERSCLMILYNHATLHDDSRSDGSNGMRFDSQLHFPEYHCQTYQDFLSGFSRLTRKLTGMRPRERINNT